MVTESRESHLSIRNTLHSMRFIPRASSMEIRTPSKQKQLNFDYLRYVEFRTGATKDKTDISGQKNDRQMTGPRTILIYAQTRFTKI